MPIGNYTTKSHQQVSLPSTFPNTSGHNVAQYSSNKNLIENSASQKALSYNLSDQQTPLNYRESIIYDNNHGSDHGTNHASNQVSAQNSQNRANTQIHPQQRSGAHQGKSTVTKLQIKESKSKDHLGPL